MPTGPASRLVFFPGMGVDGRMYDGLRRRLGPIVVPPWLAAIPGETLVRYAQRYVDAGLVKDGDIVGGSSFGGMLAQALAARMRPRAIVLMGSCRTTNALPTVSLALAHLARLMPARAFSSPAAMWALSFKLGIRHSSQRHLFIAMANAVDSRHLRWACTAIASWRGADHIACPVHQIHGQRDRVIPALGSGAQTIIPDAGHVHALNHQDAIADWLHPILASLVPTTSRTSA